jgi:hypothetical protein
MVQDVHGSDYWDKRRVKVLVGTKEMGDVHLSGFLRNSFQMNTCSHVGSRKG